MATLNERIGLSFDEDEEKQRAGTLPAAAPEAASPAADGRQTLIDGNPAASEPAPPAEPAEPKKLSPAADTPEGFDMPVVTKVEGRTAADRSADQRIESSKQAYDDATRDAVARRTIKLKSAQEDRIAKIVRAMPGETYGDPELVRRNFIEYDREYYKRQISKLSPWLRNIAQNDREAGEDILRNPETWQRAEDEVRGFRDAIPEWDRYEKISAGEYIGGATVNAGRGLYTAGVQVAAGVVAAKPMLDKLGDVRTANEIRAIEAGEFPISKYSGPVPADFTTYYRGLQVTKKKEAYDGAIAKADAPLSDSALFRLSQEIGRHELGPTHMRYETEFGLGVKAGKMVIGSAAVAANPLIGGIAVGASGIGEVGLDALRDGANQGEAIETVRRNVPIAFLSSLPGPNIISKTGGGRLAVQAVDDRFGRIAARGFRVAGESVEGGMINAGIGAWQDRVAQESYGKQVDFFDNWIDNFLSGAISTGRQVATREVQAHFANLRLRELRRSERYVEPDVAQARGTLTQLSRIEAATHLVQNKLQRATPGQLNDFIDSHLGKDARASISPTTLQELRKAKIVSESEISALGIKQEFEEAKVSGDDVRFRQRDLVKAGIDPQRFAKIMEVVKLDNSGRTVGETQRAAADGDKRLDATAESFAKANIATDDGSYAFRQITRELANADMTPAERNRQAARRLEHYRREGGGEGIDAAYLREEFRRSPDLRTDPTSAELRRLEDQFVRNRLADLGRPDTVGKGAKPEKDPLELPDQPFRPRIRLQENDR
jgi:hypothetical protein